MNVKTLCLGSLCLCDEATGYDIKKLFEQAFSHFHSASYGSIYPSLNQLLQDGLIERRVERGERHPDRKLYRITDSGRALLLDELMQSAPDETLRSDFLVLMFFAHLLPTRHVAGLLDQVIERYQVELDYLQSLRGSNGHSAGIRFSIDFGIAALGGKLAMLRQRREDFLAEHERESRDAG